MGNTVQRNLSTGTGRDLTPPQVMSYKRKHRQTHESSTLEDRGPRRGRDIAHREGVP